MIFGATRLAPIVLAALAAGTVISEGSPPAFPVEAEASARHLTLDHAIPGPDSIASGAVAEVRLFFSEAPQMRATTVRVVDSGRSLMTSTPPSAFEEDQRQVYVELAEPLPPGAYVVMWRVMAQDGHVLRGDYSFRVIAE
jgi:hypothetical protein